MHLFGRRVPVRAYVEVSILGIGAAIIGFLMAIGAYGMWKYFTP